MGSQFEIVCMRRIDQQLLYVRAVWSIGEIKCIGDILKIIPKSTVSDIIGCNYGEFLAKISDLYLFNIYEIMFLRDLFQIPEFGEWVIEQAIRDDNRQIRPLMVVIQDNFYRSLVAVQLVVITELSKVRINHVIDVGENGRC